MRTDLLRGEGSVGLPVSDEETPLVEGSGATAGAAPAQTDAPHRLSDPESGVALMGRRGGG